MCVLTLISGHGRRLRRIRGLHVCLGQGGGWNPLGSSRSLFNDLRAGDNALRRGGKPVPTPVTVFRSLGACAYGPASRHWAMSYERPYSQPKRRRLRFIYQNIRNKQGFFIIMFR